MATVGGSLAHADPSQDSPVTLMALDARVGLASAGGSREVPLDEFFTDYYETVVRPDELVTRVLVPRLASDTGSAYMKYLPRTSEDYATVGVAATVTVEPDSGLCQDCRLVLGGVGPTPLRAREVEDLIKGQRSSPELLQEAGAAAERLTDPVGDSRGSARYKRAMTGVFVGRAIDQAWGRALV
jgi:carbon-monoxide dehydrogenase medium subunit